MKKPRIGYVGITFAATERIIAATGLDIRPDVEDLCCALSFAKTGFSVSKTRKIRGSKTASAKFDKIAGLAAKLADQLDEEKELWAGIEWNLAEGEDPRDALRRLQSACVAAKVTSDESSLSSFEQLVGVKLAGIYKKHFERKAGRSRTEKDGKSGIAKGPFIRFVSACLTELDVRNGDQPYSVEAISRALSAAGD